MHSDRDQDEENKQRPDNLNQQLDLRKENIKIDFKTNRVKDRDIVKSGLVNNSVP